MRLFYLFVVLIISLTACGKGGGNLNTANTTVAAATPAPEKISGPQTVTIDSPDGLKLVGSLYEAGKPMTPALLLLHQWQSDRHSYDEFAKKMQAAGFNVLAIDGRGFGESTKKADGSTVAAGRTDADVKAMLGDVGAAFDLMSKNKNVDPKRIGIIGASYGSSLALIYSADHPNVAAVALLSPGLNYFGNMPTAPAMKKYGDRPIFAVAADNDKESADAVRSYGSGAGPDRVMKTYVSGGHGTELFKSQQTFADELLAFFSYHLQRTAK